jgi:hypothetical protein
LLTIQPNASNNLRPETSKTDLAKGGHAERVPMSIFSPGDALAFTLPQATDGNKVGITWV